jgi:hypothetical protein
MTENMPPDTTIEGARRLHRGLTEKVLDRAATDPQWRQRLLDDPEAAMQEANFPEVEQLGAAAGGDVRGQELGGLPCRWYCTWTTYQWVQTPK